MSLCRNCVPMTLATHGRCPPDSTGHYPRAVSDGEINWPVYCACSLAVGVVVAVLVKWIGDTLWVTAVKTGLAVVVVLLACASLALQQRMRRPPRG